MSDSLPLNKGRVGVEFRSGFCRRTVAPLKNHPLTPSLFKEGEVERPPLEQGEGRGGVQ